MNGNTQPNKNQILNDRPKRFARKAEISGTRKNTDPKKPSIGMILRFVDVVKIYFFSIISTFVLRYFNKKTAAFATAFHQLNAFKIIEWLFAVIALPKCFTCR
jgi:hypothetical protein